MAVWLPNDPSGRPKRWVYVVIGVIMVVGVTAMIVAFVSSH